PNLRTAKSTSAWQSAGLLRRQGCRDAIVPPSRWTISTVASAASTFRSQPTTDAPSRAKTRAASRPMLPPVPVMMDTFPDSLPDIDASSTSIVCFGAAALHAHLGGHLRDFREVPVDDLTRLVGHR